MKTDAADWKVRLQTASGVCVHVVSQPWWRQASLVSGGAGVITPNGTFY